MVDSVGSNRQLCWMQSPTHPGTSRIRVSTEPLYSPRATPSSAATFFMQSSVPVYLGGAPPCPCVCNRILMRSPGT
jgi:hypothetical protein